MPSSTFDRYEIDRLQSVAHLYPKSKGRRGLYVLEFANGDHYVGKATNVVARIAAHRRRWDDIVAVRFQRIPEQLDLDGPEQRLIHTFGARGPVRNIKYSLIPEGFTTDLDMEVTQDQQLAWLNAQDYQLADITTRTDDAVQRAAKMAQYEKLLRHPRADEVIAAVRHYVQLCVPRPRATELTFWALSACPATNLHWPRLATVSINSMETLVIGHQKNQPDQLWGFVNVARSRLRSAGGLGHGSARMVSEPNCRYEASGPDTSTVDFLEPSELIRQLDGVPRLVAAARELNLRVMRKGPTLHWRYHSFPLADRVLE